VLVQYIWVRIYSCVCVCYSNLFARLQWGIGILLCVLLLCVCAIQLDTFLLLFVCFCNVFASTIGFGVNIVCVCYINLLADYSLVQVYFCVCVTVMCWCSTVAYTVTFVCVFLLCVGAVDLVTVLLLCVC